MSARRPRRLVIVAGTATEVGKTHVAAALAGQGRAQGLRVAARKPLQSHDPAEARPTDAEILARATGERPERVCPPDRSYPVPMAPPMAAAAVGRRVPDLATVVEELLASFDPGLDAALVELAGGPRSPLTADGDGVDLTAALAPDRCLLVAPAGLGAINAVRLCVDPLAAAVGDGRRLAVVLNRFDATDPLHRANHRWLARTAGCPVWTTLEEAGAILR